MSNDSDDKKYADLEKEAEGLIHRVSEIVDNLALALSGSGDLADKEEQFKAVSKSIQTLERKGILVPDSLRDMKTSLYSAIEFSQDLKEKLANIDQHLAAIQNRIHEAAPRRRRRRKKRSHVSGQPSTHHSEFRPMIIQALQAHGGEAPMHKVLDWIENEMEDNFLPGDLETRSRDKPTWIIRVQNERSLMVKDGLIEKDAPHGIWKLK